MFGLDSDALIKLTKVGAKETIASAMNVVIPHEVVRESVEEGKEGGFPDAFEIERNINKGLIGTIEAPRVEESEEIVEKLKLKGGEAGVFRLFKSGDCEIVATDDQKFLDLITALNVPTVTPSALVIYAWKKEEIDEDSCSEFLKKLRPMISEEEYELAIMELKGGD